MFVCFSFLEDAKARLPQVAERVRRKDQSPVGSSEKAVKAVVPNHFSLTYPLTRIRQKWEICVSLTKLDYLTYPLLILVYRRLGTVSAKNYRFEQAAFDILFCI